MNRKPLDQKLREQIVKRAMQAAEEADGVESNPYRSGTQRGELWRRTYCRHEDRIMAMSVRRAPS